MLSRWLFGQRDSKPVASADTWLAIVAGSPLLSAQTDRTLADLRPLADAFARQVRFMAIDEFELDGDRQLRIAAEACLPIRHLGLDWYRDVREIVVYPGAFLVDQRWTDDDGIEHERRAELAGEAWDGGPVILAWDEIEQGGRADHEDYNVIVHEFAHVLDAANGVINGRPPIGNPQLASRWPRVFQQAFDRESTAHDRGMTTVLDTYATDSPAEFFAVASECFFASPARLRDELPELYECLQFFYAGNFMA